MCGWQNGNLLSASTFKRQFGQFDLKKKFGFPYPITNRSTHVSLKTKLNTTNKELYNPLIETLEHWSRMVYNTVIEWQYIKTRIFIQMDN